MFKMTIEDLSKCLPYVQKNKEQLESGEFTKAAVLSTISSLCGKEFNKNHLKTLFKLANIQQNWAFSPTEGKPLPPHIWAIQKTAELEKRVEQLEAQLSRIQNELGIKN